MDADKLIDLGQADPDFANMLQDLERLGELAQHPVVKKFLGTLVTGLLREIDMPEVEATPVLYPVGPANETSITTVIVDGRPVSIWQAHSFRYRMDFLMTGLLAVFYTGADNIVPLSLRLDLKEMGIQVEQE